MWPNQPQGNQPPYPNYPQQPGAPTYPPSPYQAAPGFANPNPGYPTAGQPYGQPGYPPSQPLGFLPGVATGSSYPTGSSPYPPAPGSSPYPTAPGSSPYPPAQGFSSPYPPAQVSSPYPSAQGSSPYPPAQGYSPYQPTYPPPASSYPPPASSSSYPTAPGGISHYPPQGNFTSPAASVQQSPYGDLTSSAYPTQSVSPGLQHAAVTTVSHSHSGVQSQSQGQTMQQYQEVPTIRDGHIDASSDAQILRKAMKGFGTDEAAIINVLAKRTNAQRQQISQAYKTGYGKDLIKDLKSELGGKLEDVVLALMTPRYDYLAQVLHKAISGIGTKEKALVDILCTATNQDIQWLNSTYSRLYKRTIEKDIKGDTSGHFERLLVSMTTGARNEDPVANANIAAEDGQKLLQAGEKKWGTDESTFNLILSTRSYPQLRLMFHEYERITGHSFEKAIDKEFSGDIKAGMIAIVKCAKNRAGYFAERLHQSIAGMGTKDNDLIFLLVTRAEIDLESIKQEYQRMYGKSLASNVAGDTSGDYKKILLALLGN